jgi:transmembrane sensor
MSRALHPSAADPIECAATWAARLADGQVPANQQMEFEAWLEADPSHGEALEEIIGAWDAVEHYAAAEPMMALREAALASARRSAKGRTRHPLRQIMWGLMAAGVAAVICAVGISASFNPTSYTTGIGERRMVVLADGSKVTLDAATAVRVRFTAKERRLWLDRGRAQFQVAKNPLRPFSVQAADNIVVATGTAFSVELVQKQVRVVLYEGHVALLQRNNGGGQTSIAAGLSQGPADTLLKPGREIILPQSETRTDAKQPLVEPADPLRSLAWESGQLAFNDERLDVVTERMNRYTDKPFEIANAATANVRISGVFRAGDMDALIQGLDAAFDIKARKEPNAVLLVKRETDKPPA